MVPGNRKQEKVGIQEKQECTEDKICQASYFGVKRHY